MTRQKLQIRRFQAYRNPAGSMLGFINVLLPSGIGIRGIKLMVGPAGKRWLKLPDLKRRDTDDHPVLLNGREVWDPVVEIEDRSIKARFDAAVLDALRAEHPELFEESGPPAQEPAPGSNRSGGKL